MMNRLLLVSLLLIILGCGNDKHKWEYKVKKNCSYPDTLFISTSFRPTRFEMSITGMLSDSAKIIQHIYSFVPRIQSGYTMKLKSGRIDYSGGGDIYENKMMLIYQPEKIGKTKGELLFKIEIY